MVFVFDGKADVFSYKIQTLFEVIFTKNESADDWIKRKIERSKKRNDFVLVSDDKLLGSYVRSLGAKVVSVSNFFNKADKKPKKSIQDYKLELDPSTAHSITKELRKIWLKEDYE